MNTLMRVMNGIVLVLFALGLISNAVLNKNDPFTLQNLAGMVIWFGTLGSAWLAAGRDASERVITVAYRSNIALLVLMAIAGVMLVFTAKERSAAIVFAIICVPMAINIWCLRKLRNAPPESEYDEPTAVVAPAPVQPQEEASGNYVLRHWRGQLSLPVSYWINGSLIGLALIALFAILDKATQDWELRRIALLSLGMLATVIMVTVWSMVGIWRSAGKHAARGGSAGWARAAQVMTILGVLSFSVRLVTELGPQMKEFGAIASGRDDLGIVTATVSHDGQTLLLQGALGTGSTAEVIKVLATAPDVRLIMLNSHGGRLREAEQLAKLVRERSLNTYVETQCLSACTYVFLAGADRAATPNAKIGFHQPSFPGMRSEDAGLRNMLDVYRSAGISEGFLDKVRDTSSNSMWYPTRDELIENGVINRVSLGGETASWGTLFRTKSDINLAFRQEPLMLAIEQRFPGTLQQVVDAAWQRREQGAIDAEITAELRGIVSAIYPKLLATADDSGLDEFLDLFVDQINAAKLLGAEACSLFLDSKLDASKTLPRELIDRETQWSMRQLQATSAQGRPVPVETFQAAVEPVLAQLTPDQVQVITNPESHASDHALRCESFAAFYEQVGNLPDAERSIVMRGMHQSPQLQ
jgi:hypothetical protein